MSGIVNRPFDALEVGQEDRLVHTLTTEDFSLLATQAATMGSGLVDPEFAASRAFAVEAGQSGWAAALMNALIAGRMPGSGSKLVSQTIETTTKARPGDVMTIVVRVTAKAVEGRRVTIGVRATNQHGDLAMSGSAEVVAPKTAVVAEPREDYVAEMREKGRRYKQLVEATRSMKAIRTAIVHPVDEASLVGAIEAARENLIEPVLIGPEAKIRAAAEAHGVDISGFALVSTEHSHEAAARAVAMARAGEVEALMKGALHTDELMHAVVAADTGLRTARRISHVFAIDAPAYPRALFITDAAVNIYPSLIDKRDIVQNAIDLVTALGVVTPRVAILSAVETVSPDIRSTLDAAALCKMADRGQITGGILDGPLGFDNAVSLEAARAKGIVSPVAGQADILVVPDLEAGNMLAKQLVYLADADMAGVVLGARVPIILTSRADNTIARLGSAAIALILVRASRPRATEHAVDSHGERAASRFSGPRASRSGAFGVASRRAFQNARPFPARSGASFETPAPRAPQDEGVEFESAGWGVALEPGRRRDLDSPPPSAALPRGSAESGGPTFGFSWILLSQTFVFSHLRAAPRQKNRPAPPPRRSPPAPGPQARPRTPSVRRRPHRPRGSPPRNSACRAASGGNLPPSRACAGTRPGAGRAGRRA